MTTVVAFGTAPEEWNAWWAPPAAVQQWVTDTAGRQRFIQGAMCLITTGIPNSHRNILALTWFTHETCDCLGLCSSTAKKKIDTVARDLSTWINLLLKIFYLLVIRKRMNSPDHKLLAPFEIWFLKGIVVVDVTVLHLLQTKPPPVKLIWTHSTAKQNLQEACLMWFGIEPPVQKT